MIINEDRNKILLKLAELEGALNYAYNKNSNVWIGMVNDCFLSIDIGKIVLSALKFWGENNSGYPAPADIIKMIKEKFAKELKAEKKANDLINEIKKIGVFSDKQYRKFINFIASLVLQNKNISDKKKSELYTLAVKRGLFSERNIMLLDECKENNLSYFDLLNIWAGRTTLTNLLNPGNDVKQLAPTPKQAKTLKLKLRMV